MSSVRLCLFLLSPPCLQEVFVGAGLSEHRLTRLRPGSKYTVRLQAEIGGVYTEAIATEFNTGEVRHLSGDTPLWQKAAVHQDQNLTPPGQLLPVCGWPHQQGPGPPPPNTDSYPELLFAHSCC